jgi:hypothetical protein
MIARTPTLALLCLALLGPIPSAEPQEQLGEGAGTVPSAFEPFSALIGRWAGQAVPASNPLRGWREAHEWAWAFEEGEPVGLSLTIEGGKVLADARLTFDPESSSYRLEGSDPEGSPVAFVGSRDPKTNALVLGRSGPEGEDRLTIRPNANGIRSDFWFDRKATGAPQFERLVRANLGKEGENLAAGGAVSSGPQCIVTGGAASITVSAGGSTFSVCCSGCRDEVLADPEKYAKKLRAVMASPASNGAGGGIRTGRGDGSFGTPPGEAEAGKRSSTPKVAGDRPAPGAEPADEPGPKPPPEPSPPAGAEPRRKAASLLRLGRSLEKQGKADGALAFYRRIVAEAPGTPEASTAKARIKALSGDD